MELQDYLRDGGTPEQLTERYGIKVRAHGKYPKLLLFKYDQINSPMHEKIVQQCRGIILDSANNWAVVCRPYDKFFNLGESHAPEIDWSTANVFEKLDGSLMTVYWYDGAWQVSSSGSPDASGSVNDSGITFADLFWKVWNELGYVTPEPNLKELCFIFELMTPQNRIVVQYDRNRIVLHGVRGLDGQEYEPEGYARLHGYEFVKLFPLGTIDDVVAAAKEFSGVDQEGFVVRDDDFRRIKVKAPAYVAIHHLIGNNITGRRVLDIVRLGEAEEVLVYRPEWTGFFKEVKAAYTATIEDITRTYEEHKGIESKKDFAQAIIRHPFSGIMFSLRAGKIGSVEQGLQGMPINGLAEKLGIRDIQLGSAE